MRTDAKHLSVQLRSSASMGGFPAMATLTSWTSDRTFAYRASESLVTQESDGKSVQMDLHDDRDVMKVALCSDGQRADVALKHALRRIEKLEP